MKEDTRLKLNCTQRDSSRPLFSFAVVADTHINESEHGSTSPFETNQLANPRARRVFKEIAAMDPAPQFVVHLGDIVHPVPSLPIYAEAVEQFKTMRTHLPLPLHLVPGNHDVGDKRVESVPTESVCDKFLEIYRAAFGRDYFSFDHAACRFVIINSLLLNSGLDDEPIQSDWLEEQLADAGDRRVFLFMHYPPYVFRQDEPSNYDGIDYPARQWLLAQIERPNVEAVFAGHVHNFWYDRIGNAELYMLPSTAFVRHDYTEFYRVSPSVEYGRGDLERFGYFVVNVYSDGHVAHSIRTMGRTATHEETIIPVDERFLAHPKSSGFDRIGVELRHPWTESMQIASTGGIQEFGRKWARNDYPLLAMWEMGLRLAKVPEIDVRESESRARMNLQSRLGQQFLVTSLGSPKPAVMALNLAAAGVSGFEINATTAGFEKQLATIRGLRDQFSGRLFYSRIHSDSDSHFDGKHFTHFIKAGFTVDELKQLSQVVVNALRARDIDGITVRVEAGESLVSVAEEIIKFAGTENCHVLVSLKLAGSNIAQMRSADSTLLAVAAQAMVFSQASERVSYVFDTFMDVDRGYFPRQAFIDRRFNPRPSARAFATLNAVLSELGDLNILSTRLAPVESIGFEAKGKIFELVSGTPHHLRATIDESLPVLHLESGRRGPIDKVLARDTNSGLETILISRSGPIG